MTSKYKFGKKSIRLLADVHPDLARVAYRALSLGVMDFTVTTGKRTLEEQARLYAQGRTQPGPKVTWTMKSNHITGHAIDIAPWPIDWDNETQFAVLAGVMKVAAKLENVELEWGYDLWGKDLPHYQMKDKK